MRKRATQPRLEWERHEGKGVAFRCIKKHTHGRQRLKAVIDSEKASEDEPVAASAAFTASTAQKMERLLHSLLSSHNIHRMP